MEDATYKLLEAQDRHLKELMNQHDNLVALAIQKAEDNLTERLEKVTSGIESLAARFEQNIKSVSDRYDEQVKTVNNKIDTLADHMTEKLEMTRAALAEKRDAEIKNLDEKIAANIKVETAKFLAVDSAMDTKINANAEVSNAGLKALNEWRLTQQGGLKVIYAVGGAAVGIIIALLIAYLTKFF